MTDVTRCDAPGDEDNKTELIRRQALRNSAAGYLSKAINLLVSFGLVAFMVRQLGGADYGLWVLVGAVVAYGGLCDCGIASAITKYVAEYHALGKLVQCRHIVASSLWLYGLLGSLVAVVFLLLAPFIPALLQLDANRLAVASQLLMVAGIGVGLSIPLASTFAVLNGLQRFDLTACLNTGRVLLFALGAVSILLTGGSLVGLVLAQIVALLVIQLPALWWIKRLAPELRFGLAGGSLAGIRAVSSFSWSLFIVNLGGQLQSKSDEIVIGARLPTSLITPYALALKLSEVPQLLADQFLKLILPMASELHAQNDRAGLQSVLLTSTRLTLAVFLAFGISLAMLAEPLLTWWVGEAYAEYAFLVPVLLLALLFDTIQWPAAFVLQAMNRHRIFALTSIITGVANVVLSLALIPYWGLMGVAVGTLVPALLELALVMLPYTIRVIGITPGQLVRQVFIPAVLPAVPMVLFWMVIDEWIVLKGFGAMAVSGLLAAGLYILVYLWRQENKVERELCMALGGRLFQALR